MMTAMTTKTLLARKGYIISIHSQHLKMDKNTTIMRTEIKLVHVNNLSDNSFFFDMMTTMPA